MIGRVHWPPKSVRQPTPHRLLAIGVRNLPHELRPRHVHCTVHGAGLGSCVVFQDFHHQARVIRDDHAGLQHTQKTDLSFGLAERSGGVDGHIGVEALANGGDGGERRADFEGDARKDQLLAAGRGDGLGNIRIVERVD
jgi:hypothetical protein